MITSQNLGFLICEKKITTSPEIRGCVETQARSSEPQAGSTALRAAPEPAWSASYHGGSLRDFWVRLLNCHGGVEPWVPWRGQMGWEPKPRVRSKDRQGEETVSVGPEGNHSPDCRQTGREREGPRG